MTQDAHPDEPDLLQLLEGLRFAHWHSLLLDLCSRFDGWLVDFLQQSESEPDFRPMVDILEQLRNFPRALAGDDLAVAKVIASCDFLARAARDRHMGVIAWDPFEEPYKKFAERHPARYPYWEAGPARAGAALTDWLLTHSQVVAVDRPGAKTVHSVDSTSVPPKTVHSVDRRPPTSPDGVA